MGPFLHHISNKVMYGEKELISNLVGVFTSVSEFTCNTNTCCVVQTITISCCFNRVKSSYFKVGWLVVLVLTALSDSISVYIGPSPREREKEMRNDRREIKCPNNPYPHLLQEQWVLALLLSK